MTMAVTGAAGHIGANLTRALLERGERVRAIEYKDSRALDGLELERVKADIFVPESLDQAFAGADVVFHLAAKISIAGPLGGLVDRTNVEGVRNVVDACLRQGVRRLVHFSSVHAFSTRPEDETIDEEQAPALVDRAPAYNHSKARGQQVVLDAVKERGLDAVIVNPAGVIGPCDYKPSRMGSILLKLYHRQLPASIDGGYSWVDARCVSAAAIAAAERGRCGERYILSGHWHSINSVASTLQEVTGRKNLVRWACPIWLAYVGAPFIELYSKLFDKEPLYTRDALHALKHNSQFSHAKATEELGFQPRPFHETIADSIAWFREEGYLKN